jgi:hypothetical protein
MIGFAAEARAVLRSSQRSWKELMTKAILILSVLCLSNVTAYAASEAVREACKDDAMKLCHSVISNTAKRQACMRAHSADLSERCRNAVKASRTKG